MRHLGVLLFPLIVAAQIPDCGTDFIDKCISSAVSAVCGAAAFSDPACICGSSGFGLLQSSAGLCLLQSCPGSQILSIGGAANSVCDQWQSTHVLTGTSGVSTMRSSSPTSTTSSGTSATGTGITITSSATLPSLLPTTGASTGTGSGSAKLSTGAKAGIAVGASVLLVALLFSIGVCLYRRRHRREVPFHVSELQAGNLDTNKSSERLGIVDIPLRELDGEDAFRYRPASPVEADSRSARAGHPKGKMAGTEATAFDFDSQKVLLEPGVKMNLPGHGSSTTSLQR